MALPGESPEHGADGLLPEPGEHPGEGLHVDRGTIGHAVDIAGDFGLAVGQVSEVIWSARVL
ncbi:hypothetical protein [Kitasatospora sp. GAS204B]|uniref:hypothetical protein n=1 Tax=Kitasatospora sp. GAS204B TaxID=3035283 RepID=UPI0024767FB8|nr:hypothetical protein [Kitasatospora sp. GAS204B]